MTKPIQSTLRSLDVLTALNRANDSTVAQITAAVRLPRGTVFRILETLRRGGFVRRADATGRYRLTEKVRWLSDGFRDLDAFDEACRPIIEAFAAEVLWPVTLTAPRDLDLVTRVTTDQQSPFAEIRSAPGLAVQWLGSAAGHVYLAHCDARRRDILIRHALATSPTPARTLTRQLDQFRAQHAAIRKGGFAYFRGVHRSAAISVPVMVHDELRACLSVRFFASAVPEKEWRGGLLPRLRETAERIGEALNSAVATN
ncbi:MAG: helix-turn-helix domain-containing protein [Rhodospirillaceae bacterium]|nr:helix-turn-helix domain-containing protein [Rhodospirillaceae bacterium]